MLGQFLKYQIFSDKQSEISVLMNLVMIMGL